MIKKNENIAEYGHFKRVTDEKIIKKIKNINENPKMSTPKKHFEIAKLLNIDITYEELCE